MKNTQIIQGGMGIGISGWRLAKTVSQLGQLGVVSSTCLDSMLARLLQRGDGDGHLRRAMESFPDSNLVERVLDQYFNKEPLASGQRFIGRPMPGVKLSQAQQELIVLANFVEVFLAKEGHQGQIGINLLEKLQVVTLPSLYGAMLAGVDYVIMGAGIPREIPGSLDKLALHEDAELKLDVFGAETSDNYVSHFSPQNFLPLTLPPLNRPQFLAIISSNTLAVALAKKANGKVNGFIVEKPTAGGHNAPPRGPLKLSVEEEPIYGTRDEVNLKALKKLGLPFWMAGGYGSAEGLQKALKEGAEGIQVGTLFALCNESGMEPQLKKNLIEKIMAGRLNIKTDAKASPTGFPFKVAQMENTCSEEEMFEQRPRCCDLGYLRKIYKKEDGSLGYRCASEPKAIFLKKGGSLDEIKGRKCLCNALMANIGLGQTQVNSYQEKPLITLGDDILSVKRLVDKIDMSYSAKDVIDDLRSEFLSSECSDHQELLLAR